MNMLEGYNYIPLLYTKGAELTALEHLDTFTRSAIFPIVICRPGQFNDFYDNISNIKNSTEGLRIAIGLDETCFGRSKKQPARQQFDTLFDATRGFTRYFELVREWESALPILQSPRGTFEQIDEQLHNAFEIDRGYLVRVRRSNSTHFLQLLNAGIFDQGERSFILDAGWSVDILQSENWFTRIIGTIVDRLPMVEIACISSSFPKDFTKVRLRGVISNDDRELFDRVRRSHNEARLTYGDWASTREPDESIASTPRPRIDVPTPRDWISFRLGDEETDGFRSVARRARQDRVWLEIPDSWGKRIVELTSLDLPQQIRSSYTSNCCRINMHITIQAMGDNIQEIPEAPFIDSF